MRIRLVLAALLALPFCLSAHADTFQIFDLHATLNDGANTPLGGTLLFDATDGIFLEADLTTPSGSIDLPLARFGNNTSSVYQGFGIFPVNYFVINIPGSDLEGYTGGDLCAFSMRCDNASSALWLSGNEAEVQSGTLTLAQAPEPASFLLLGTGLLFAVGAMKSRHHA